MKLKSFTVLLFVLSLSSTILRAQVSAPIPAMTLCQQDFPCITVHFNRGKGEARWSDGGIANLTIQSYDGQTIRIKRDDSAGKYAGLQGEYKGSLDGFDLKGKITWSWPGHGGLSTGSINWTGTPWATPEPVPVSGTVAQSLETQFQWGADCAGRLKAFHANGTADGEVTITPQGNVAEVKDTHHAPAFCTLDCLAATWAWHFHPYMVNGKPTAMRVTVHLNYNPGGDKVHTYK